MTKSALRNVVQEKLEKLTPAERDGKSSAIRDRLAGINAFQAARRSSRLMIYISFGNEVQTVPFLLGHSVIVPFCNGDEIVPFCVCSPNDLESTKHFGILEPKPIIRENAERQILPEQINCVVVPGLAFDLSCNRLGRGKGYYDRFLCRLSPHSVLIALAFECQIFERIPVEPWDHPVSMIVTENRIISL